ncbi:hypothetical protein [Fibrobacter sp.]|uniref:hypothetical protein n=1 Tax=Fibrobacter sp. TaxID=35828 RepID=UPI00388EF4DD
MTILFNQFKDIQKEVVFPYPQGKQFCKNFNDRVLFLQAGIADADFHQHDSGQ